MARCARDLFREGLDVFESRDIDRARDLEAADDRVDLLYTEAMNLVANPDTNGGGSPEWRVRAALTVHYLERIADHGVDIGERTVFLVTGERMASATSAQSFSRTSSFSAGTAISSTTTTEPYLTLRNASR